MDQNQNIPSSNAPTAEANSLQPVQSAPVSPTPITPQNNPPVTPAAPTAINPNNKNKKRIVIAILIVLGLLILGGLAGLFISKQSSSKSNNTSNSASNTKADAKSESKVIANCLKPDDYASVRDAESLPKIYDDETQSTVVGESIFFKPNSTAYEYDSQVELFDKYAKFYSINKEKSWNFEIQGQIKDIDSSGNTESNKKLANDRAQKIVSELSSRGFDTKRIVILEPEVYAGDDGPSDSDRNVSITLDSQCIKDKESDL